MILRIMAIILLILTISGCSVNLNSLRSDKEYNALAKPLTKDCDLKFPGFFVDITVKALLVHKSLKMYLPNIPENKTRIDFILIGRQENFNIEKIMFTIKTDNGIDYKIAGLGGEYAIVNGTKNDNLIGYIVNSNRGGTNQTLVDSFSLILPFELTNKLGTLRVHLQSDMSENICKLKWTFSK